MSDVEQVQPLARAACGRSSIEGDDAFHWEVNPHPHRKYVKCCGCVLAVMLILVVVVLVLIFTLFRSKSPVLRMHSVWIEGLDEVNWTRVTPNTKLLVFANVSVQNPNMASVTFSNASTTVYYDGNVIGEALTPPGNARARRTTMINVTVDVMVKNTLDVPRLKDDFIAGIMPLCTYTRLNAKVRMLSIVRKSVYLKTICSIKVNLTTHLVQDQDCDRQVIT